jgi:hypothetical protein
MHCIDTLITQASRAPSLQLLMPFRLTGEEQQADHTGSGDMNQCPPASRLAAPPALKLSTAGVMR